MLRFASTAEEQAAESAAWHLLNGPTDEMTLGIAKAMVERLNRAQNQSKDIIDWLRALAAYREHMYQEGLDFLDRFRNASLGSLSTLVRERPHNQAHIAFLRAMLGAELGRTDDAGRDFTEGRKQQQLARGDKRVQDRGERWWETYGTEIVRREAEALFKAKGIPLPEPDAK